MSFRCEHCGVANNEVLSASAIRGEAKFPIKSAFELLTFNAIQTVGCVTPSKFWSGTT
jgi:hypothetical protein